MAQFLDSSYGLEYTLQSTRIPASLARPLVLAVRNGTARSSSAQNYRHPRLSLAYSPADGAGNPGPPQPYKLVSLNRWWCLPRHAYNIETATHRTRPVVPWHCLLRRGAEGLLRLPSLQVVVVQ